jgi:hypothetical protein
MFSSEVLYVPSKTSPIVRYKSQYLQSSKNSRIFEECLWPESMVTLFLKCDIVPDEPYAMYLFQSVPWVIRILI